MQGLNQAIRIVAALALAVLLVAAATAAQAQLKAARPAVRTTPPAPDGPVVISYAPERVRARLMAIHGFTRNDLSAVSTDVPAILRGFIANPAEPMVVRRQAIKALRLYADEANFLFIRERIAEAPLSLKRLYVGTLRGYAQTQGDQIPALLGPLLASPERTLRHAAVGLAAALPPSENLRAVLQDRLPVEPDPELRRDIRKLLSR